MSHESYTPGQAASPNLQRFHATLLHTSSCTTLTDTLPVKSATHWGNAWQTSNVCRCKWCRHTMCRGVLRQRTASPPRAGATSPEVAPSKGKNTVPDSLLREASWRGSATANTATGCMSIGGCGVSPGGKATRTPTQCCIALPMQAAAAAVPCRNVGDPPSSKRCCGLSHCQPCQPRATETSVPPVRAQQRSVTACQ